MLMLQQSQPDPILKENQSRTLSAGAIKNNNDLNTLSITKFPLLFQLYIQNHFFFILNINNSLLFS